MGNYSYLCLVNKKQKFRTIITYKEYFENFFVKQRPKVKDKIIWTFDLIEEIDRIPETYLKYMEDGLFEFRVQLVIFFGYFAFLTKKN